MRHKLVESMPGRVHDVIKVKHLKDTFTLNISPQYFHFYSAKTLLNTEIIYCEVISGETDGDIDRY